MNIDKVPDRRCLIVLTRGEAGFLSGLLEEIMLNLKGDLPGKRAALTWRIITSITEKLRSGKSKSLHKGSWENVGQRPRKNNYDIF